MCIIIIFFSLLIMIVIVIYRVVDNDKDVIIVYNIDCGLDSWEFRCRCLDEKY